MTDMKAQTITLQEGDKAALAYPRSARSFSTKTRLEGVKIGNDDLRLVHRVEHVVRYNLAACVVAVGIVRL